MEGYTAQIIPASSFAPNFPYHSRYHLEASEALTSSLKKRGVLYPLVVTGDSPAIVISGHKRYQACRALGIEKIPVFLIQKKLSPAELFFLAVISNAGSLTELDRACSLARAVKEFRVNENEILDEWLPLLGLAPEKYFLEESLEVASLAPPLLDLISESSLSFRGARALARLKTPDQVVFAQKIASRIHLTTNQLTKTVDWLVDLLRLRSSNLGDFLESSGLDNILKSENVDLRQKAEKFCGELRRLRFPKLVEREEKFQEKAREFEKENRGLSIEAPAAFEAEGLVLKAKLRRKETVEQVLERLRAKKSDLYSFFDILS